MSSYLEYGEYSVVSNMAATLPVDRNTTLCYDVSLHRLVGCRLPIFSSDTTSSSVMRQIMPLYQVAFPTLSTFSNVFLYVCHTSFIPSDSVTVILRPAYTTYIFLKNSCLSSHQKLPRCDILLQARMFHGVPLLRLLQPLPPVRASPFSFTILPLLSRRRVPREYMTNVSVQKKMWVPEENGLHEGKSLHGRQRGETM